MGEKRIYPTSDEINALPEPLRRYIHDLETRCDPAGELQERAELHHRCGALEAENAAFRTALEFYADPNNWCNVEVGECFTVYPMIDDDTGDEARKALGRQ